VENSLLMASALSQYKIPFEMHVFPKGGHGLCLATEETAHGDPAAMIPEVAQWMPLSIDWLRRL
jgi:dipeptidyl aminopeptidase/acylaminoacyl peptidase